MYDDKYIEEVTLVTRKILKKEGAIRIADNKEADPDGLDVKELLAELENRLGHSIGQATYYNRIRPMSIRLGFGITAKGRGQYIGKPGEAVAVNTYKTRQQFIGRGVNMKKSLIEAGESKTLDEGNEWSKSHYNMDLLQTANFLDAVSKLADDETLRLPKELKTYLLEASKK